MPMVIEHGAPDPVGGVLERIITDVPMPRTRVEGDAPASADAIMHAAARRAALLSGSLALPPGPLGMATVLPDLYLIWKIQRQMVADLFGMHGRTAELTRTHMLYCLFRHAASHVVRDVAVRTGQRVVIQQLSVGALRSTLGSLGIAITQRAAGNAAGRWIPAVGAVAVASYAYWDTLQVAKTARKLLEPAAPAAG
ncbi:MAG: hypothetical protein ABI881_07250 [Betaproteobacteria bacterium]